MSVFSTQRTTLLCFETLSLYHLPESITNLKARTIMRLLSFISLHSGITVWHPSLKIVASDIFVQFSSCLWLGYNPIYSLMGSNCYISNCFPLHYSCEDIEDFPGRVCRSLLQTSTPTLTRACIYFTWQRRGKYV